MSYYIYSTINKSISHNWGSKLFIDLINIITTVFVFKKVSEEVWNLTVYLKILSTIFLKNIIKLIAIIDWLWYIGILNMISHIVRSKLVSRWPLIHPETRFQKHIYIQEMMFQGVYIISIYTCIVISLFPSKKFILTVQYYIEDLILKAMAVWFPYDSKRDWIPLTSLRSPWMANYLFFYLLRLEVSIFSIINFC